MVSQLSLCKKLLLLNNSIMWHRTIFKKQRLFLLSFTLFSKCMVLTRNGNYLQRTYFCSYWSYNYKIQLEISWLCNVVHTLTQHKTAMNERDFERTPSKKSKMLVVDWKQWLASSTSQITEIHSWPYANGLCCWFQWSLLV